MEVSLYEYGGSGANSMQVTLGRDLDLYFSYKTVIAFRHRGTLLVRVNDWNTTTGKHLNVIDGGSAAAKKARVSGAVFMEQLTAILERLG